MEFSEDPPQVHGPTEDAEQGRLRDQAGRQRDAAAGLRDDRAARRDQAADERDHAARRRRNEPHHPPPVDPADTEMDGQVRAADSDRNHAHVDRVAAANDRADSAVDRQEALVDRMAAARDRRRAGLDGLTGLYNREAGLQELNRDLARASRTAHQVVVAFIDVDHLKTINDTRGHAAGDRVLITVADTLVKSLRPYDLIIRYGGDEFLCAAADVDEPAARLRFARVNEALSKAVPGLTVTVGLAQLRADETCESVIARADADLYQSRQQHPH